jgi:hypothetical protein
MTIRATGIALASGVRSTSLTAGDRDTGKVRSSAMARTETRDGGTSARATTDRSVEVRVSKLPAMARSRVGATVAEVAASPGGAVRREGTGISTSARGCSAAGTTTGGVSMCRAIEAERPDGDGPPASDADADADADAGPTSLEALEALRIAVKTACLGSAGTAPEEGPALSAARSLRALPRAVVALASSMVAVWSGATRSF